MTPVELTALEIAAGRPIGTGAAGDLPRTDGCPRRVLERTVAAALAEGPCFVAFSGGRDSSALLAVAVQEARRHGLPLPVPATLRFPGAPDSEEREWQEAVISHLELRDWELVELGGELDYLGARARTGLLRHGLLWPENAHAMTELTRLATGGTLISGLDGDGLFGDWRWAGLASVLAGRARMRRSDVRRLGRAFGPSPVRRRWRLRALPEDPFNAPWLTPEGRRRAREAWAEQETEEPRRWDRRVGWYSTLRYARAMEAAVHLHLADCGWRACLPFMDGGFLAALARDGGRTGYGDRTAIMRTLFGDLLPEAVIARADKAVFHDAFWGPECDRWAREWDGAGIDPVLVDADALRRDWALGSGSTGSLLLQWTWLQAQRADGRGQGVHGGVEVRPVTRPADLEHR